MKKGMNVWSLPANLSLREQFRLTKEAGFDTIELNVSEEKTKTNMVSNELGLNETLDLLVTATKRELEQIKQLSEEFELPISSLSTSLHWSYPLTSEDEETQKKGRWIVERMIDICRYLGGDTVLIVPGLVTDSQDYETCYERAKQAFIHLSKRAEAQKIVIGVENVWNKFLLSPLEFRQFLDEINSPYVGAYFDVGNVLQFGFPEQWIQILAHRIVKVHVKDFKRDIGNIHGFTNLLLGDVNWARVMNALRKVEYAGPLTCELAPYSECGEQLAEDTSAALSHIFKL